MDQSTRDIVAASFESVEDGLEPHDAPEIVEPELPEPEVPTTEAEPEAAPEAESVEPEPEPAASDGPESPSPEPERGAPSSWSSEAKAEFDKLPDTVRKEIARREADFHRGVAEFKEHAQRARQYDEIVAPYEQNFRAAGVPASHGIASMLETENVLRNADPITKARKLLELANAYGADLSALSRLTPEQARLAEQQEQLRQRETMLQRQVMQQQQHQNQEVLSQIEQFSRDPANEHFDKVKGEMSVLLQSGQASSLRDAYDQAVWMRPEIRQTLIDQQRADAQQKATSTQRQARARTASLSLRGSSPANAGTKPMDGSVRDIIASQFN